MLGHDASPDATACHEAGHVVVGLHFGLAVEGVDLVPKGTRLAVTTFGDGELQRLNGADLAVLAYSGTGGQQVAGLDWSTEDYVSDLRKFGAAARPGSLDQAKMILRADGLRFQQVAARLRDALDGEPRFVPIDELLRPPETIARYGSS